MNKKERATAEIALAIRHATAQGYKVIVASDPEGNNWHTLNPDYMIYSDTNNDYIALGTWEHVPEEIAFEQKLTKQKALDEFYDLLKSDPDFAEIYCDTNSSFEQWLIDYEIEITHD